jgi:opacity protein-like surface antigen
MKTKTIIIAGLAAVLFTCQTLQAQVKFAVHAAGNLETQAELGQLWNNVDLYQGFLIGGTLEYGVNKNLSFQTELNYQKKGAKLTSTLNGSESVERKAFNYLSVPVLVKGNFHDKGLGDNWDLSLFTGPYMGYLTSAHSNIKIGNNTTPVDIENQAEKTDWGLIFGGGVSYKLSNGGAVIAELRYQMGLSEVDNHDPDLRNKGMGITIGYRF